MKKKSFLSNSIKKSVSDFVDYIKNPKRILADFIYILFGKQIENVPFPLLGIVLRYHGGWPGISIFHASREYSYKKRIIKLRNLGFILIIPGILLLLYYGIMQTADNFLFGFAQNLFADIILIILIVYLLPRFLNRQKNYGIVLEQKTASLGLRSGSKEEILLSLINTGEEVYNNNEICWQIFIPPPCFKKEDI